MYTAGSLELHRGVEIQLCKTHKHRNIYQLCVKLLSCGLNGSDTFIGLLSLALNHNATFAVVGHWDAYLGLRLTRKVLYCTLISRPKLEEGLWPSISFTTIFTALSLDAGLWLPLILKRYYLKILTCCQELFLLCYFCSCLAKCVAFYQPSNIFSSSEVSV